MVEQITYVAFDDTDFINREDCLNYEAQMYQKLCKIKCWNYNLEELPIVDNGDIEDLVDSLNTATEKCFLISLFDEQAAKWCNDYFGCDFPTQPGFFYYYGDEWLKVENIIKLADRLKELM